jgi:hypothetical protein
MDKRDLRPIINAMLKDEELLCGGIFTKEEYYAKKYNLTLEEISNMQVCIYYALNIKNECYNRRVSNICYSDRLKYSSEFDY